MKKILILMLAMMLMIMSISLVSCNDNEESCEQGSSSTDGEKPSTSSSSKEDESLSSPSEQEVTITFVQDGFDDVVKTIKKGGRLTSVPKPKTEKGYEVEWDRKTFTSIEEDIVVEAVKTPIEYKITYELNGGTNNSKNPEVYTVEDYKKTFYTPTHPEGSVFLGWYTTEDFEQGSKITKLNECYFEDITLYACWLECQIDVAQGFEIDSTGTMPKLTMTVSNPKADIDLSQAITVSDGCTWKLYKDFQGNDELRLKAITLGIGENKAYIIVYHPDGEHWSRYEVSIYRLDILDYKFVNGTAVLKEGEIEEQASIVAPNANPTKSGYTFKGWAVNGEGIALPYKASKDALNSDSCIVIEAVFEINTYDIDYVLNKGTNNGQNPSTYTVEQAITLKNPTRTGYTFAGWYSDSSFNTKVTSIAKGTTGNKTLYAKWTPNNNTLVFNANGGSGSMSNMTIATDASKNLTNNAFTRAGYTFKGWATSASGSVVYQNGASYKMGTNSSYTLYAVWQANTNTLVFNANGGTGTMSNMTIATDASKNLTNNSFTRTGYTFKGWATSASGSVVYQNGASYKMGTNSSYTLYAVWEINNYNITYVTNGGTNNGQNPSTYTIEQAITLKNPTRAGYTFNGWYSDSAFNTKVTSITKGSTGNKTLYAKWTPNNNTVVFNANGGTGTMSNMTIATDASKALTSNTFTKAGYTFKGWATSASGSVVYQNGASYKMGTNSSYTLYAVWELTNYNITYNLTINGADNSSNSSTYTVEDTITLKTPTKKYYDFLGWYTDANFENEITEIKNSTGDITLYAKWVTNDTALTFIKSGSVYSVTDCVTDIDIVIIPDIYNGLPVTSIENYAFSGCDSLTSVTIGDSVTSIGYYAFYNCTSLTSVTIGDGVTSIGTYAFSGCTSLTSVNISDIASWCNISFGNYYANPLYYAKNLYLNGELVTDIVIPSTVTEIKGYAFYNYTSLTSIEIPDSVTSIGGYAFYECTSLTRVTIGDGVTSIGEAAFDYCTSLTSIVIPDSVTSIGNCAFSNCTSLTSIVIPNSVTWIGYEAFWDCFKLVEVYNLSSLNITKGSSDNGYVGARAKVIHTSLDEPSILETVNDYIFMTWEDKYYLVCYVGDETEITLPDNYKGNNYQIYYRAFYDRDDITKVTIPNSVTSIGNYAFYYCDSLTSVTIPNSVTSTGNYAFYKCTSLTSVTIGNSVTSIGDRAFEYCYNLVEVYNLSSLYITKGSSSNGYVGYYARVIHKSLDEPSIVETTDDGYVFAYVSDSEIYLVSYVGNKTELTLPESYKGKNYEINQYAFYERDDITNVTIPDSVTSIGDYAFEDCDSLRSVTIGGSVTSIGDSAFYSCDSLTSITIPNSVTSIGNSAFAKCASLTSITIGNGVTSIGSSAFYGCTSLTSVTIPNSVTWIGYYAFYNCTSLTSITIGNGVTSIGDRAFYNCTSLTSVTFENPNGWWYASISSATSGTSISSSSLSNTSTAAEYLTSTYTNYYWKRS